MQLLAGEDSSGASRHTLYVWCQGEGTYLFCSHPTLHSHYIVKMTHSQASGWKYHQPKLKFDLETVSKKVLWLCYLIILLFSVKLTLLLDALLFQFVSLYKMPPMVPSVNIMPSEAIPCALFAQWTHTGEVVYLCVPTCFIYESFRCILVKCYNGHTKICRVNSIFLHQYKNG